MKERDGKYLLTGAVEVDDAFCGDRRGRGTTKSPVIIEVPTRGEAALVARMKVVDAVNSKNIKQTLASYVNQKQTIKTDGFRAYQSINEIGYFHDRRVGNGPKGKENLPWVHPLILNAKVFSWGRSMASAGNIFKDISMNSVTGSTIANGKDNSSIGTSRHVSTSIGAPMRS